MQPYTLRGSPTSRLNIDSAPRQASERPSETLRRYEPLRRVRASTEALRSSSRHTPTPPPPSTAVRARQQQQRPYEDSQGLSRGVDEGGVEQGSQPNTTVNIQRLRALLRQYGAAERSDDATLGATIASSAIAGDGITELSTAPKRSRYGATEEAAGQSSPGIIDRKRGKHQEVDVRGEEGFVYGAERGTGPYRSVKQHQYQPILEPPPPLTDLPGPRHSYFKGTGTAVAARWRGATATKSETRIHHASNTIHARHQPQHLGTTDPISPTARALSSERGPLVSSERNVQDAPAVMQGGGHKRQDYSSSHDGPDSISRPTESFTDIPPSISRATGGTWRQATVRWSPTRAVAATPEPPIAGATSSAAAISPRDIVRQLHAANTSSLWTSAEELFRARQQQRSPPSGTTPLGVRTPPPPPSFFDGSSTVLEGPRQGLGADTISPLPVKQQHQHQHCGAEASPSLFISSFSLGREIRQSPQMMRYPSHHSNSGLRQSPGADVEPVDSSSARKLRVAGFTEEEVASGESLSVYYRRRARGAVLTPAVRALEAM